MAVLTINWQNGTRVAPDGQVITPRDGETEEVPANAERPRLEKPLFVYITAGADTEGFDKIESVVLTDDKIAVGTNAFRCVKVTPEDAASDPILAEHGRATPRFVLIATDWDSIEVLEDNQISVSKTYSAMKKIAKRSYTTNFDKNVRDLVKLLGEFDKINNERKLLQEKEERMGTPSEAEARKLAKEREELDEREKDANEEKTELLTFELREA